MVLRLNKLEEARLALRVRNEADKHSYGRYLSKACEERLQLLALLRKTY